MKQEGYVQSLILSTVLSLFCPYKLRIKKEKLGLRLMYASLKLILASIVTHPTYDFNSHRLISYGTFICFCNLPANGGDFNPWSNSTPLWRAIPSPKTQRAIPIPTTGYRLGSFNPKVQSRKTHAYHLKQNYVGPHI